VYFARPTIAIAKIRDYSQSISIGNFPKIKILRQMGETRRWQWYGFSVKELKK